LTTLDIQVCIHTILFLANLTFRGPCIVIYSYNRANEMHCFSNLFDKVRYVFQTGPLSIIRSISTPYTRNRYLSC